MPDLIERIVVFLAQGDCTKHDEIMRTCTWKRAMLYRDFLLEKGNETADAIGAIFGAKRETKQSRVEDRAENEYLFGRDGADEIDGINARG